VAYVAGSLAASAVAGRFGRRRGLIGVCAVLAVVPLIALATLNPAMIVVSLLVYTFVASLVWPALESLVSSDADAHALSRRVGLYNLVWSAANAVTFAASGIVIATAPRLFFALPAFVHAISALLLWRMPGIDPGGTATSAPPVHAAPEPQLLARRTLALCLARIALPATYVVIYSLMAMMPSLPVMRPLDTATQTVIGSIWMVARWLAFLYLGATLWWHTKPLLLLGAAGVMLVAFVGVAVRPTDILGNALSPQSLDLASMIAWQIVLGVAMGINYAGSLYFGMVLSDGSTEHGGSNEALIGLGSVLGPGTAALTQWKWPGSLRAGVIAVSCVVGVSLLAASFATIRSTRKAVPPPTP
jgi:MFS family permease